MTYAWDLVDKKQWDAVSDYWLWWILATILIGAELATGTFYLLAAGIAFAFGGAAAFAGASPPLQLLTAGILAVVGTVIAHRWRRRQGEAPALPGLDIGQSVRVDAWHPDGTARVEYRGTQWDGVLASDETPRRHTMYIVATRGSTLVLSAERPDTGR
jgi:membrane protein implicated in regulation of membrane protease activity